ncbi:hypothetical protein PHA51_09410, partial [Rodentibacter pneumotropicus]|nr:hypothetical protein [Rodentibacter pneumotropicus]
MKNIFLLVLSFFTLSNVFAKDGFLFNPCTNEKILLNQSLFSKNILLNKKIELDKVDFFLISYLDNKGEICHEKKYDLLFKLDNAYLYNKDLFNEMDEVFPDIDIDIDIDID